MGLTLAQEEALSRTNTAVLNDANNTLIKADLDIQTDQKFIADTPPTIGTTVTTGAVATLNGRRFFAVGRTVPPPETADTETINKYQQEIQDGLDAAYNNVLLDIQNAFGDDIEERDNIDLDIVQTFRTNISFPGPKRPDPSNKPKETPQQTQDRRTRQKQKEQTQNKSIEAVTINTDTELPKDQQPSGQDKLNQLTVKKAINFVGANLGVVDQVLASLGLPNSKDLRELEAQGEQAIKAFVEERACANPDLLKEAVRIRNLLNQELGKLGSYYNLTNESINQLSDFLSGQINSSKLLKTLRGITSQASKIIPSPPGVPGIVTSTLSDVSAVVDLIIFSALGQPKLAKAKATIDNGLMFLSISAQALKVLLGPLRILDQILVKCGQTIDPIPDSIVELEQLNQTENFAGSLNYKGFTLEIREEPFSNTVTRRKAVAINSQGIVLVETPLSFTTLDQVLLDQVKFVIDSQNLKPF